MFKKEKQNVTKSKINSNKIWANEGAVFFHYLFWELFNQLALAKLRNKDCNYQIKITLSALSVCTVWHEQIYDLFNPIGTTSPPFASNSLFISAEKQLLLQDAECAATQTDQVQTAGVGCSQQAHI